MAQPDVSPSGADSTASGRGGPADRAADAEPPADRQICRRIRPSNSYRSQRVCRTAEQWRQMGEER